MSKAGAGVYVYGVMSSSQGEPVGVRGVAGADVRAVGQDGLLALTSSLAEPTLTPADVRAHWRVLERAFSHATVLPIRFGTVLESDAEVRDRLLQSNGARLSQLLRDMAGLVQLNVRGRYEEE